MTLVTVSVVREGVPEIHVFSLSQVHRYYLHCHLLRFLHHILTGIVCCASATVVVVVMAVVMVVDSQPLATL